MRGARTLTLLGGTLLLATQVASKAAIAHYMLGKITVEHAKTDLRKAKAAGFDAFAMNVGCVESDWVDEVLGYMFKNAAEAGMGVYLNMDLYASGDACFNGASCCDYANDYTDIWNRYKGSDGWFKIDGRNVVSTFSAANWSRVEFNNWRDTWDEGNLFFMPDCPTLTIRLVTTRELKAGVDGIASWESAWPEYAGSGGAFPGDVGPDMKPFQAALYHGAEYMIPLSPLQYKAAYKTNLYRLGDMGLPVRMENILAMNPRPNYVQFQTWNDGPESHYIGDIWPEQNHDYQPWKYMNPDRYDHSGWQPLVRSFNDAFKSEGSTAASMDTSDGKTAEGAIWYPSFPRDTVCKGPDGMYSEKPINYDAGVEGVYFAIVMKQGLAPGYTLKAWSGNTQTPAVYSLKAGLNYGSAEVLNHGAQYLEILDPDGRRVASAAGGMCVAKSCPRGIYVRNYHVTELELGDQDAYCVPWPREVDEPDPDPAASSTAATPVSTWSPTQVGDLPQQETGKAANDWEKAHSKVCLFYNDSPEKSEDCSSQCKDIVEQAKKEHRTTSYGCVGFWPGAKSIPWEYYPSLGWITEGYCTCDDPVLNLIGDTFLEALPAIAEIGCYLLMSSFKLVVDIGLNAIPEGRALTRPLAALVDAAKLSNYVYDTSQAPDEAFGNWLNVCGDTDLVPDEIKKVFDTLNMVADSVTSFRVPSKIGKGSGRKGDKGNPKSPNKPTRTKGPESTRRPSETACHLKPGASLERKGSIVTGRECHNGKTTTHAYTITSVSYAATAQPTLVAATCQGRWDQACHHYSSAISPELKAAATDTWSAQHAGAGWLNAAYREEKLCDKAVYPPSYLLATAQRAPSQCGADPVQVVRWLPRDQNRGAAHMWNNICFQTPLDALSDTDMYDAVRHKNFGAKTRARASTKTEYTVGITVGLVPQFTIASWEHKAKTDDGLWDNPCWPKEATPTDPGFALLENDPWYTRNNRQPAYDYEEALGPSNGPANLKRRDWIPERNEPFCNGPLTYDGLCNSTINAQVKKKLKRARDWFGGDCDKPIADAIVLPEDPRIPAEINYIRSVLDERKRVLGNDAGRYEEFTAPDLEFTAYFWIKGMGRKTWETLNDKNRVPQIRRAYFYEYENHERLNGRGKGLKGKPPLPPGTKRKRMHRGAGDNTEDSHNHTTAQRVSIRPVKRDPSSEPNSKWHLGQISTPPNVVFRKNGPFTYNYDNSLGNGQTIFILDDGLNDIPEELGGDVEEVLLRRYGHDIPNTPEEKDHGTLVAAYAGGRTLGMARKARMIVMQTPFRLNENWPIERFLESLINVANRCIGTKDSTVVNMSWGLKYYWADEGVWEIMEWLMKKIEDKYGTMFVVAAGNDNIGVQDIPAVFAATMPNLLVIGGSTKDGTKSRMSNHGDLVHVHAPGAWLDYPPGWPEDRRVENVVGTSYAAPQVAGLVAYIRAHPGINAQTPSAVKAKVLELSRTVKTEAEVEGKLNVIWNGQHGN
ncbi:carbohydrate-binding module family 24 protein [Apiospora marii]|uniref:Carbohydrate-binding module family 24 protein n=1 Tax=Apiospora marii TaxID=335849 RepID=A0ABR1SA06_9PEZI